MKKILSILILLLLFTGCSGKDTGLRFSYRQRELAYGSAQGVIGWETREAPGKEEDIQYLLTLYLEGPLDDSLVSPFPKGTALESVTFSDQTIYVTLSEVYAGLDGMEHTVASACLARTCFDLTNVQTVVIKCNSREFGNKSITLTRDSLVLTDDATAPVTTEPTE